MPIVSAPATPVITPPAAQPAAAPDAAAPAGATHDGRRVSAGAAQGPIAPALAGAAPAPSAAPARTVAAPPGADVNRAAAPRRPDRLRASLLQRLARHVRESFDKLVARFRQRNSQDVRASAPARSVPLEALQRRVDAFADATARSAAPEPEPVVGEYLGFPEETIEWMKEYNQPAAAPDTSAQAAQDKLPKNFNVDEFVARLDQELAMQDEQIRSHEQLLESDPALAGDQEAAGLLKRMSAERDARSLTRAEALAGRNPLPALYAQAGKLDAAGDRAGAAAYTGWARKAFTDTAEYLAGSGNELLRNVRPERVESLADLGIADIEAVELMILDGKTPRTIDFRGLSRQWGAAADRIGAQSVQTYPQGPVETERANDVAHVEGYMLQAVAQLSQGLDPRQDLLRHAQDLENKEYADGGRLVRIPQELRTMAAQYEALLQENLGYRAGADWLDQVRSLRETARQEP
ncbi:MAG: hypothetical protein OXE42_14450 [Gammaproteobacteria bacterium]|nr:hypothetical protein [Gammaproteobacteria bacterium]